MKRFILIMLALCSAIVFSACGADDKKQPYIPKEAEVPNPVQTVESLKAINSSVGCAMRVPDEKTVTDEKFHVISGTSDAVLGEYTFVLDGTKYVFRAAKTEDDITGVHVGSGTLGSLAVAGADVIPEEVSTGGYWARWFDGMMQYVLYSSSATYAQFIDVYYSLR